MYNSSQHASIIVSLIRACFCIDRTSSSSTPLFDNQTGAFVSTGCSRHAHARPLCTLCNLQCAHYAMCTLFTVQTPLKSPTTSDKASPLVYPSDPHFLHAFKTYNLYSMTQNLSSSLDLSIDVVFHRSDGWGIFWWYNHSKNQPGLILGAGILSRLRPIFDPLCSLCVGFWSIWGAGRMGG